MDGNNINVGSCLLAAVTRVGNGLQASCGLVCTINKENGIYETFLLSTGDVFVFADGKKFKVVEDGI